MDTTADLTHEDPDPADRRRFVLDDATWDEFVALLDRPVEPCPELTALFARPCPWDS